MIKFLKIYKIPSNHNLPTTVQHNCKKCRRNKMQQQSGLWNGNVTFFDNIFLHELTIFQFYPTLE